VTESGLEHAPSSANFAARLDELGCAALVDAMGRIHDHRAHILPMASPDPAAHCSVPPPPLPSCPP